MPGPQVKNWPKYEALREKGYSKRSSARIANANPGKKVTKSEANYRRGGGERRCENCVFFRGPDRCTKVAGAINPAGLSDLFRRRK